MNDIRKALSIDFDELVEQEIITREFIFEEEDQAVQSYRALYEALNLSKEVLFGEAGESFTFYLYITITSPYIITLILELS